MKDFFVKFYEDFTFDGEDYKKDQIIHVILKDVWEWIEYARENETKLVIFEAEMVCDLS